MKVPKSVVICGKPCKIVTDKTHTGGSFNCTTMVIEVGTANPDVIEENFIHEVSEAILAIRDYRYVTQALEVDSGDYRFFMNHKEFQLFCCDLSIALRGINFTTVKK